MRYLLVGFIFCAIYFFIIQYRRFKYHKISKEISGDYIPQGLFKTGLITGKRKEKRFIIEPYTSGIQGGTHFRTISSLECRNKGLLLLIKPKFFNDFPNWENIYQLIGSEENRRIYESQFQYSYLDKGQRKIVAEFFSELNPDLISSIKNLKIKKAKIESIRFEKSKVCFDFKGILIDSNGIDNILDIQGIISDMIEKFYC